VQLRSFCQLLIAFLGLITISFAWGAAYPNRAKYPLREEIYPINIRYGTVKKFPLLPKKVGLTIGIAPFKDTRVGRLYIGHYIYQRVSNYLKSDPFPLEKAIRDSLSPFFSLHGIKAVSISNWDGKQESLKNIETDSILMIEIERFWTEGREVASRTNVNTSIYLVIHLGVKKEGRVFTQNFFVGKEIIVLKLTPEKVEEMVNQILTDIFDTFFSNPY